MESVVGYSFVFDQYRFLLRICILVLVMFPLLQGKLDVVIVLLLFFLLIIQVVCFLLSVSGSFPAVQTICTFGNFIRIN